ncbi:Autophagy protein 16 [Pestalotiopsis fici W106-1]|uniref:Autophagy protein 16 n=1 Tax=Pestalotiopsis fici (strain W106-1 / CGMCC3.15140) TaxID=1229662 RepID=W3X3C2_PESFW|nr:Autophagy protein 16 [Pestalotiopsis fici W106-1]ETS80580.1 Autophagy protein 16 [Pestalotiopsis fici W106-1]
MPDWRSQYLANLHEAEFRNPINKDIVSACSQLADRVAALEAEKAVLEQKVQQQPPSITIDNTSPGNAASSDTTATAQLRLDLAEALRSRGQLQAKQRSADTELTTLRAKSKADDRRVRELTAERNSLAAKLRDRTEELVGKNRLLKDVQDDNLTLNIQLDVRENECKKIKAENKELVDRWMKKMEKEAEAMNLANEPQANGRKR